MFLLFKRQTRKPGEKRLVLVYKSDRTQRKILEKPSVHCTSATYDVSSRACKRRPVWSSPPPVTLPLTLLLSSCTETPGLSSGFVFPASFVTLFPSTKRHSNYCLCTTNIVRVASNENFPAVVPPSILSSALHDSLRPCLSLFLADDQPAELWNAT